ncbi:MAG: hypothetical protein EXR74_02640 [Bdellovibrionales bacterium]|nr:hypothetical protein [Bdellovibrionales bacterium]
MRKNKEIKLKSLSKVGDRGVRVKSNGLKGKDIAVAICGGIASVESVKIIRELRRHGASITAFYTPEVTKFITELPVAWASGKSVITGAQAQVEHLESYDLVLVVPATLNTISKSALGLADNVVTLLIASQIGKKGKLLFVPTMNTSLWKHPLFLEYQKTLESWGAQFLLSQEEEERIKVPDPEKIAETVSAILGVKSEWKR